MSDRLTQLRERLGAWISRAQELNWLDETAQRALGQLESHTPAELFSPGQPVRPLTFAWNGGPGSNSLLLHLDALGPRRLIPSAAPIWSCGEPTRA